MKVTGRPRSPCPGACTASETLPGACGGATHTVAPSRSQDASRATLPKRQVSSTSAEKVSPKTVTAVPPSGRPRLGRIDSTIAGAETAMYTPVDAKSMPLAEHVISASPAASAGTVTRISVEDTTSVPLPSSAVAPTRAKCAGPKFSPTTVSVLCVRACNGPCIACGRTRATTHSR